MTGVQLIAFERARQIEKEGWTAKHDEMHTEGELRDAAICYAMVCDPRAGENTSGIWRVDDGRTYARPVANRWA